ncbi:MAG: hypothetical protein GF398_01635 [Chitinivibrionales bacterium]|nr:hypothetical protein [Chitinivibrionales bacterium]
MKKLGCIYVPTLVIFAITSAFPQRDPWFWPFAVNSIWNLAIHQNAQYIAADIAPHARYSVDVNYLLKEDSGDPQVNVYKNTSWGAGRCTNNGFLFSMHFPNYLVVPDARQGSTPNNNLAFLMLNGMVRQNNVLARCNAGGPVYMRSWYKDIDPKGDGVTNSVGQGASGMSSLGGTIRKGELVSDEPIRHALKFTIWADEYFYYQSNKSSCYRWPARACDSYADQSGKYRGINPKLVMGILLAIKPEVSLSSQNIETEPGKKIFAAMQTYGGYIVEDAAWDCWYFITEKGVREEVQNKYGVNLKTGTNDGPLKRDMDKIVKLLHIIDNNSADNIGGGPTDDLDNRLADQAPPFDQATKLKPAAFRRNLSQSAKSQFETYTLKGQRIYLKHNNAYRGAS